MEKTVSVNLGHFMPMLVMKRAFDAHVSFVGGPDDIQYSCTIPLPDGEEGVVNARVTTGPSGSLVMMFTTARKIDITALSNAVRRELIMLLDAWDSMTDFDVSDT